MEATILKVFGSDPYNPNARTELVRRGEKVSVNMAEVQEVRFLGINITRDGIQKIEENTEKKDEKKEEVAEPKSESEIPNVEVEIQKEPPIKKEEKPIAEK